ncbi:YkoF family thiamine/hydroxymethylpyrimidine-binding protein [Natronospora cellulosivora (SeqCode)]
MLSAEVAIYPENNDHGDEVIYSTIQSIKSQGVSINVDHMSSRISGEDDEVWSALRSMSQEADDNGEFSMVITISNH